MDRSISHVKSVTYLFCVWGVVVGAVMLYVAWPSWITLILAICVISTRQSAMLIIEHECWHYNMFRSRRANDFVGSALSGWAVGSAYYCGRQRHLDHHRHLGCEADPDYEYHCTKGKETGSHALRHFFDLLFGKHLSYVFSLRSKKENDKGGRGKGRSKRPRQHLWPDLLGIAVTQSLLFALGWLTVGWWFYPVVWMLPLLTLTTFANGVRAMVEHFSFEGDDVDPDKRLYTIEANWLETAFFSPMNFNYHAEHHAFPSVSAFKLPSLRKPLLEEGRIRLRRSYVATLLDVLFARSRQTSAKRNEVLLSAGA